MTGERSQAEGRRDLASHLANGDQPILLTGPMGIGKSFVAKEVVAELLSEKKGIGLYWGWQEESSAQHRVTRDIELIAPQQGLSDWSSLYDIRFQEQEIELPGKLTPAMLLSLSLRELAGRLGKLSEKGLHLILILDRYDDFMRKRLSEDDRAALAKLSGPDVGVVLEVRDRYFPVRTWSEEESKLLRLCPMVEVAAPTLVEAKKIAVKEWERAFRQPLEDQFPSAERIVDHILSLAGRHPGTLILLLEESKERAQLQELQRKRLPEVRQWISRVGNETHVQSYLRSRWEALEEDKRFAVAVVALAEKAEQPVTRVLKLWIRAHGDPNGSEWTRWRNHLRELSKEWYLLEGECKADGDCNEIWVSGDLLREFVYSRVEAEEVLELTGVRLPSRVVLDWNMLLILWLFGILWYLLFRLLLAVTEASWDPVWRLAGWLLGLVYAMLVLFRRWRQSRGNAGHAE